MAQQYTLDLIDILRATLRRSEQTQHISPDDPALRELKHSILRTIAELEIVRLENQERLSNATLGHHPIFHVHAKAPQP